MLSLPILSIGGRDAAYILGVIERGCFYDVTLAYDEALASLGPGVFLMQRTLETLADDIEAVISHGAHDYKRHWATAFVPQRRMYLFSQRPFCRRRSPRTLSPPAALARQAAGRLNLRIDESTN